MCYYVYADHAQYTIKTYAKMSLFALDLTGPLSLDGLRLPVGKFGEVSASSSNQDEPAPLDTSR